MLKPQDIVVLLKVRSWKDADWTYAQLANSLDLSASEVHAALKRCAASGLYDDELRKVLKQPLLEFLIHGLKYAFPSQPGAIARGMPTAHSASPLKDLIVADPTETYVWPSSLGKVRGQTVKPLYRCVPSAAAKDAELYILLSLIDGIRVGRVREQRLAAMELTQRIAE